MVNRVVLGLFDGAMRLRVSLPGNDALVTTLDKRLLAFDSTWTDAAGLIASGNITFASPYVDILYGETFTTNNIPIPIFYAIGPNADNSGETLKSWAHMHYLVTLGSGTARFGGVIPMTDRLRIYPPISDKAPYCTGGVYMILRRKIGLG